MELSEGSMGEMAVPKEGAVRALGLLIGLVRESIEGGWPGEVQVGSVGINVREGRGWKRVGRVVLECGD